MSFMVSSSSSVMNETNNISSSCNQQHHHYDSSNDEMIRIAYEQDGVVGPLDILTPSQANEVLQEVLDWEQEQQSQVSSQEDNNHNDHNNATTTTTCPVHPPLTHITGNDRFKPHLILPKLNHWIVRNPQLIHNVQVALQSSNILLWSCDFNIKHANTDMYYAPHQDATYTGLYPPNKCLTAWIALTDPVSELEGCLQFWKGSHRRPGQIVEHEEVSPQQDPYNMLSRGQRIKDMSVFDNPHHADHSSPSSTTIVTIPLRAGQATLHHFLTVHQSGPNRNPHGLVRVGLACRYIDASVIRNTIMPISSSSNVPTPTTSNNTNTEQQQEATEHTSNCNQEKSGIVVASSAAVVASGTAAAPTLTTTTATTPTTTNSTRMEAAREFVTWISGQIVHDGFDLEPILPEFPTLQQIEEGRRVHEIAMEREAFNYFHQTSTLQQPHQQPQPQSQQHSGYK